MGKVKEPLSGFALRYKPTGSNVNWNTAFGFTAFNKRLKISLLEICCASKSAEWKPKLFQTKIMFLRKDQARPNRIRSALTANSSRSSSVAKPLSIINCRRSISVCSGPESCPPMYLMFFTKSPSDLTVR